MARKRGSKPKLDMTSFMDIITATVGNVLLILLLLILCSTENPSKDIVIKIKQLEQTGKEKLVKYVETTGEGVTLHPIGQKVSMDNMEKPNSGFMEFIRMIDRDNEYIIFAIRPDGYKSFQKARDLAEKNQVEVGFEPIDKLWNLEVEDAET